MDKSCCEACRKNCALFNTLIYSCAESQNDRFLFPGLRICAWLSSSYMQSILFVWQEWRFIVSYATPNDCVYTLAPLCTGTGTRGSFAQWDKKHRTWIRMKAHLYDSKLHNLELFYYPGKAVILRVLWFLFSFRLSSSEWHNALT